MMNVVRIEVAAGQGKYVVMTVRAPNLMSHAVELTALSVERILNVVLMVHALQKARNVVGLVSA
jgi:hypothetical protein